MIGPYDTPQAFRAALEARLRNIAHQEGTDLQRLQRRVAFERLLARLFVGDDPPWLLKGGYALELRFHDRARSTLDLDLSVPDPARLVSSVSGDEEDRIDAQVRLSRYPKTVATGRRQASYGTGLHTRPFGHTANLAKGRPV